jgi:hypothetical protein
MGSSKIETYKFRFFPEMSQTAGKERMEREGITCFLTLMATKRVRGK